MTHSAALEATDRRPVGVARRRLFIEPTDNEEEEQLRAQIEKQRRLVALRQELAKLTAILDVPVQNNRTGNATLDGTAAGTAARTVAPNAPVQLGDASIAQIASVSVANNQVSGASAATVLATRETTTAW